MNIVIKIILIFFSSCYYSDALPQELAYPEIEYILQLITVGKRTGITEKNCQMCNCGQPNRWNRIIEGWMTEIHEYPWMAALTQNGQFFCGGTLINDRYVLTAAHCVHRNTGDNSWVKQKIKVVLAEHNMADLNETMKETHKIADVFVHENFSRTTYDNDIALLKLEKKVTFRNGVRTACLPPPGQDFGGNWATVAGWGTTTEGGSTSVYLRETTVPVLSKEACAKKGYKPGRITDNMICAGDYKGQDSCQGDSGGALLWTNEFKQMLVIGVVSWGEGCGRPNKPGVYTRVNNYLDWILKLTDDSCYCF